MATRSFSKIKFTGDQNNIYEVKDPLAVHDQIKSLESSDLSNIPVESGAIFTYELEGGEAITFGDPPSDRATTFELWLTMPDPAVLFSFVTNIQWADSDGNFKSENTHPDFSIPSVIYRLAFQYTGRGWLGNLSGMEYLS